MWNAEELLQAPDLIEFFLTEKQ